MPQGLAVLTGSGTGQRTPLPIPAASCTEESSYACGGTTEPRIQVVSTFSSPTSKWVPHSSSPGRRPTQALEVGSGPFGKEFWGPGGQNMGDGPAPGAHALGRQVACSEARVEQEEGTGVLRT